MSVPTTIAIAEIPLRCRHCNHELFTEHRIRLDSLFLDALDLEWFNSSASVFACAVCGCLHQFLNSRLETVRPLPEPVPEEDIICLNCQKLIPAGTDCCKSCGWSYRDNG